MIAVETNILVYAHRAESPFHQAAKECVAHLAEGSSNWGIPWPCVHEFLGIVTHPRIYRPPTPLTGAFEQLDAWLQSPTLMLLAETDLHLERLRELAIPGQAINGRIHDARIAAICLQHGVRELWSADRDFSRFPALNVVNPLTR